MLPAFNAFNDDDAKGKPKLKPKFTAAAADAKAADAKDKPTDAGPAAAAAAAGAGAGAAANANGSKMPVTTRTRDESTHAPDGRPLCPTQFRVNPNFTAPGQQLLWFDEHLPFDRAVSVAHARALTQSGVKCVSREDGERVARDIGAKGYVETSALTSFGLTQMVEFAARLVRWQSHCDHLAKKRKKTCALM